MFQVVIVGRPNVGKSTLFNRLCGARRAIVGDEPGITRDRIYADVEWNNKSITLLDTGGLVPEERDIIPEKVSAQVVKAVQDSDLVLLVLDGRAGITPLDELLLPMLRKSGRPVWAIVNKIDTPELEMYAAPFFSFGVENVFPVSAEHGRGTGELLDAMAERVEEHSTDTENTPLEEIKVAVVGRPNVGKSSLVNRLLGFERTIVTDLPGTTRDAIDTLLVREGIRYRIVDTAGMRRKGKEKGLAERISVVMAQKSLKKADVALLLLDAAEGVTKLDAAIAGYAAEAGCSVIIVANKWDLIEKSTETFRTFTDSVRRKMKHMAFAPVLTISALNGQRVSKLFELICRAYEARRVRIPTGTLNNIFIPEAAEKFSSRDSLQKLGIRYITQTRSAPPTFTVFLSGRTPLYFSTERFVTNRLREQFNFFATPIRIYQKLRG